MSQQSVIPASSADFSLARVPPGPGREAFVPLLLLADEPEPLRGYLQDGDLYALRGAEASRLG